MIQIEVCIDCDSAQSVHDSVRAALSGGADRIELCRAMTSDGLTPIREHILEAREAFQEKPGLMVMIRPRSGNFSYSKDEIRVMHAQIRTAAEANADGVVFGVLRPNDNTPDREVLKALMETSRFHGLKSTFHRAFDAAPHPLESLEDLIECGVDRVLTSGTRWGAGQPATQGTGCLRELLEKARNRIEIVIGGGVNPANVTEILTGLPWQDNKVSIHAYSGVQEGGVTTAAAVGRLAESLDTAQSMQHQASPLR